MARDALPLPTMMFAVATVLSLVVASANAELKTKAKRVVNIRSKHNLELNCPNILFEFPSGTLRCESCRAVGQGIAFLVERRSMDPLEALDVICPRLLENAVLQQTRNGLRYWDLSALRNADEEARAVFPLASNFEKVERKGAKSPVVGPEGEPEDPFQVTYHTPDETVLLPCAHYHLQHYCENYLDVNEEHVEECLSQYRKAVKDGATEDRELESRPNRAPPERGGKKLNRDKAAEQLRHCLTVPLCEVHSKDCHAGIVAAKEQEELDLFRKYQGRYGASQFPYVADRQDTKMYEKNPFVKGGSREGENDLLQVPLEERDI